MKIYMKPKLAEKDKIVHTKMQSYILRVAIIFVKLMGMVKKWDKPMWNCKTLHQNRDHICEVDGNDEIIDYYYEFL